MFAVEASSMAEYTRQLVKQNGCEEVVTVLQGRAEDIHLPERVDILLSEWMGNCLLAVSNNTRYNGNICSTLAALFKFYLSCIQIP